MRHVGVHACLSLASCLLVFLPGISIAETQASNTVVHIGHGTDDLHAASMGMSLARLLQKKGASVTVFLDREGVRIADDDMPEDLGWGAKSDPVVTIMAEFVKAGGRVLLCSHCAAAAGIDADDLLPGARIASEEEVARLFLAADRVIDY